jgi:hypothetical protein
MQVGKEQEGADASRQRMKIGLPERKHDHPRGASVPVAQLELPFEGLAAFDAV